MPCGGTFGGSTFGGGTCLVNVARFASGEGGVGDMIRGFGKVGAERVASPKRVGVDAETGR